jgi:rod shape-determining protein MreB
MGLFSGASGVAIDLGTVNTCIFAQGTVALNEPSIVALNTARGNVEAVGADARDMLGRTPVNITSIKPIRHGVIADFDAVEKLLEHFVKKVGGRGYPRPRLVIGVAPASTQVERRAVKDCGSRI